MSWAAAGMLWPGQTIVRRRFTFGVTTPQDGVMAMIRPSGSGGTIRQSISCRMAGRLRLICQPSASGAPSLRTCTFRPWTSTGTSPGTPSPRRLVRQGFTFPPHQPQAMPTSTTFTASACHSRLLATSRLCSIISASRTSGLQRPPTLPPPSPSPAFRPMCMKIPPASISATSLLPTRMVILRLSPSRRSAARRPLAPPPASPG